MSSGEQGLPAALRERVFADLRPVRPLAEPWKRALVLAPIGFVLLLFVHLRWGTRTDLGVLLLWGMSLLQVAVGIGLVVAALREVIPGRALSRPVQVVLIVGGFALAVGVTYAAWHASPSVSPAVMRYRYWKGCLRQTVEIGLPALLVILVLAARGVMWRPGLVGGLAGLAAGLMADAGWRTFCSVTEPGHVLSAHIAGIALLAILGVIAAKLYAALRL